jgi:hypothetical protein
MKRKILSLAVGLGAGYVLGARAGRSYYDMLSARARELWEDPRVASARADVETYAKTQAPIIKERAEAAAKAAPAVVKDGAEKAATAVKDGAEKAATAVKDVASRTTVIAKDVAGRTSVLAKDAASTATSTVRRATGSATKASGGTRSPEFDISE